MDITDDEAEWFWNQLSKLPYGVLWETTLVTKYERTHSYPRLLKKYQLKSMVINEDPNQVLKEFGLDQEDELVRLLSLEISALCQ